MAHSRSDGKNRFWRELNLDKDTRKVIKDYIKLKKQMLDDIDNEDEENDK